MLLLLYSVGKFDINRKKKRVNTVGIRFYRNSGFGFRARITTRQSHRIGGVARRLPEVTVTFTASQTGFPFSVPQWQCSERRKCSVGEKKAIGFRISEKRQRWFGQKS